MVFFRQVFRAFLCYFTLLVFLENVHGIPKPQSSIRSREKKKIYERVPLIKAGLGATYKLRCSLPAKSTDVKWYLNNKALARTYKDYRFKRRRFKEILVISNVKKKDAGIYSCVVGNKKRVACRMIVTSDKRAKYRKKRSPDAVDICNEPKNWPLCGYLNFSTCASLAGDPLNVVTNDSIDGRGLPYIKVQWTAPRQGRSDLWGYEIRILGLYNDANKQECHTFFVREMNYTYTSFGDLAYDAKYEIEIRSLPSLKWINKPHKTKEKCQYPVFKNLPECCTIMNLNGTVMEEEGKIDLTWNYKCTNHATVIKNFLILWDNIQMQSKCSNHSVTSTTNYTIHLGSECRKYNYSIRVYIYNERRDVFERIVLQYPTPKDTSKTKTTKHGTESGSNTTFIATVVGSIVGAALVIILFFIYKYFFAKVIIKLPSSSPPPINDEAQEKNDVIPINLKDCPKRVLIMHARCCEKCNWVVHCLGVLLNATNLVETTTDLWHMQEIASDVMRWYQNQVRDADCVLVLASNTMRRLCDGENMPNRENSDLLPIRAQINLVSGEMSQEPDTPKFISAYFTYNGQSTDVPSFLYSRLTHQLSKDLERLVFHVLKIEAIQPRRFQPIAVIGGPVFDKKKDDLLRAVSEAEHFHALRAIEA